MRTTAFIILVIAYQPVACYGSGSWLLKLSEYFVFKPASYILSDILNRKWHAIAEEADKQIDVGRVRDFYLARAERAGASVSAINRVQQLAERLAITKVQEERSALEHNLDYITSFPWNLAAAHPAPEVDVAAATQLCASYLPDMKEVVDKFSDYCVSLHDSVGHVARPLPILCIVGPKQVSKAWIAKSMSMALHRSSVVVGSVPDEALVGDGGLPSSGQGGHAGFFAELIARYGDGNPLVILDDVDQFSAIFSGHLAAICATATGPVDNYLGAAPDYSTMAFIATATDPWDINPDLRNRMEFVYIDDYSAATKVMIAKTVLCEMAARLLGVPRERSTLSDEVLVAIVRNHANEPGTNLLINCLNKIFIKAKRAYVETGAWPELNLATVERFLVGGSAVAVTSSSTESPVVNHDLPKIPTGNKIGEVDLDNFILSPEARHEADDDLEQIRSSVMSQTAVESRQHLRWLLSLPWKSTGVQPAFDLASARRILDEDHFGLREVKDRILDHLAVNVVGGRAGIVLCLAGPPGVGKTSIAKSIARSLGRPFARAALGGVSGEPAIRGYERAYVSAAPGKIIKAFRDTGVTNPVILLDEIDKLGHSSNSGDPASALLEVLDPEQNKKFVDAYIGIPYDLSSALFLVAVNNIADIPTPLRDRLEIIELPGYVIEEKMAIAKKHLVPRIRKLIGLADDWNIADDLIMTVIEHYTREAGVRELERQLKRLAEKQLRIKLETGTAPVLTPARIVEFLGAPIPVGPNCARAATPGVATGLSWSTIGGDCGYIETALSRGKGEIISTGSLGQIISESLQVALGYVRSNASSFGIDESRFATTDFHVHFPAGAVPKDGPSAGITFAISLISALTNKICRADVAMTGEIDIHGNIWPVGGLREKLIAARRNNIKTVFVPFDNKNDIDVIEHELLGDLNVIFVKHAREVVTQALAC